MSPGTVATLRVGGFTMRVRVTGPASHGRVYARCEERVCYGDYVGSLRNSYIGGYRTKRAIRISRLTEV